MSGYGKPTLEDAGQIVILVAKKGGRIRVLVDSDPDLQFGAFFMLAKHLVAQPDAQTIVRDLVGEFVRRVEGLAIEGRDLAEVMGVDLGAIQRDVTAGKSVTDAVDAATAHLRQGNRWCRRCGTELPASATVCTGCGRPLGKGQSS
jgi:hypothetical protein